MQKILVRFALVATASFSGPLLAQTAAHGADHAPASAPVFATVNGETISAAEFYTGAREMFNKRFFHRQPPENERLAILREFGQSLVDRNLIDQEIRRRNITPDAQFVQAEIDKYEKQYAGNPTWMKQRESVLPGLRAYLELISRRQVIDAQVRDVPRPSPAAIRAYYDAKPELFTEPEKVRVGNILLPVDPSSPAAVWKKTEEDAGALYQQLLAGASFEDTARKHSRDPSAANGGDLGYLHQGTLSPEAQEQVDKLQPGAIGAPVRTLQGYMILKVIDRQKARLRDFKDVEARAADLLHRDLASAAYESFVTNLRRSAKVEISPEFRETIGESPAK